MNLIKISVISLISFVITFQATAQIQFGAKVGLNLSNLAVRFEEDDNTDVDDNTNMLLRYHIGATANYNINDALSLQPSLLFSIKGASTNYSENDNFSSYTQKGYSSFYYLDVPINLAYKINNFQIYAGPYAAFGIGGRSRIEVTQQIDIGGQVIEESETIKIKNKPFYSKLDSDSNIEPDQSPYNGFDYGLNAGVGYKMNNLLFNVGYSYGLGNWIPRSEGDNDFRKDNKVQNRVINFSVSYFFGE